MEEVQIRNRHNVLKKDYGIVKSILNSSSGFGWDDVQKMVTASDDVWAVYLAVRSVLLMNIDLDNLNIEDKLTRYKCRHIAKPNLFNLRAFLYMIGYQIILEVFFLTTFHRIL